MRIGRGSDYLEFAKQDFIREIENLFDEIQSIEDRLDRLEEKNDTSE